MDQASAIIGILGGMIALMTTVMLTVMIYLDRSRRAEIQGLKDDLRSLKDGLRALTVTVFDLVKTVGELKGRMDAFAPVEASSIGD